MKKLKKMKEDFKEQNLLGKARILFLFTITFVITSCIACIAIYFICAVGTNIMEKYTVEEITPLSSEYNLLTYENGTYKIVRTADNKRMGKRFSRVEYEKTIRDSIIFLFTKDYKMLTFSLKTGVFSEDSYDNIDLPDPIHHYCACSQKGLLGFLDCHTGKVVIPLKFYANNQFFITEKINRKSFYPIDDYPETVPLIADVQYKRCNEIIDNCRRNWKYDNVEEEEDADEGIIQFKGDYCVVPTTIASCGVIDTEGKLLIDGYDWINYLKKEKLFKAVRNQQYSLWSNNELKCLLSDKEELVVLPIGVILPQSGILTNLACTDTLTDIILDEYDYYDDLTEYGYGDYVRLYNDWDAYNGQFPRRMMDNSYKLLRDKLSNYKEGVKDGKTGETVIEPIWENVRFYKNDHNQYLFSCTMNGYRFLLDEKGNFLSRR